MEIGRRRLLGLGAGAAVAVLASSCSGSPTSAPASVTPRPSRTSRPTPSPTPAAFPGQPAAGDLYYGASVPFHRSLAGWERELGSPLALNRSYFAPDRNEARQLVARCRDDLANGRLPHVSSKADGTWADVAAGRRDAWLASMLAPLGELGGTVLFTLHHEPENDAGQPGMMPDDWTGMQRRAVLMAADLAPSVVVAPVLQHWTFDPSRHDVDPGRWLVPEAPVAGLDVYNPWSPANRKEWRSFGSKMDEVLGWFEGRPLVIGEYGCRDDPQNPGLAAQWIRDAAAYAREHGIVSMSYFNSGLNSPEGTWEMSPSMQSAFASELTSDWVARPA